MTALLVVMAVLCAKAQDNKGYTSETVEGNGNLITRDYDVAAFDEISMILPATVNYTVANDYSCNVTLDENLFEYLNIHTDGDELILGYVLEKIQHINLTPTKFVIELGAPKMEKISIAGSTDFCFVTPVETRKLKIQTAGSGSVVFKETANIHDFDMQIAGSGKMICKKLLADSMKLNIAGSGDMIVEDGAVKSANISIAGSGSVETRCQLEAMDYTIAGSGTIRYLGHVKVQGKNIGGRISRIDSENVNCKTKK